MKKIVKKVSLISLIILSFICINSSKIFGEINKINYSDINKTQNLQMKNLSISNIVFKDNSNTSSLSFGLSGQVTNNSSNDINYNSIVYYYDSNYNLIAKYSNSGIAIPGTSTFNQMSNLDILGNHKINEIVYYSLEVSTSVTNSTSNITPSKLSEYNSLDYVIDKYDVNIIVNENNTLDITETITAYFNVSKHGIYRTIPLINNVKRLDGTTSKNYAKITNLSIDNEYTTSRENGNYKIKIGSNSKTLTGEQTYVIKYTYNLGKDPVKNYDELYYNIIGNEWDTVIGNITFNITMPKEFDSSKLGFSSGKVGSTDNSKIKYNVSGNKIIGSYNGILGINEALTIRCELDEGYFENVDLPVNIMDYIMFLIPIIFLIISILLWYIFGRDNKVVETVEFYPPEGFNSLEVGFLYKGKANNQDVTSLLIYLANKGYIKISEFDQKTLFSTKKTFKITKLKEYDGDNINEELFLKGLFKKDPLYKSIMEKNPEFYVSDDEATLATLQNNFYLTMRRILKNINSKENEKRIFEKSVIGKTIFIVLMIIATFVLITVPALLTYGNIDNLIMALLFPGLGFSIMIKDLVGGSTGTSDNSYSSLIFSKIFIIIYGLIFGGVPWAISVLPALIQNYIYLIGYIVGILCVVGMFICIKYLPKRTGYGNELLGKIKGFKNFLEIAEKEKLEELVMQNPTYFYDILPYTYVLGISNKWIKKFESIAIQSPSWYDSPNAFNFAIFGSFLNSTMTSACHSMSPSSSGGGSSGGGSSGGGSGGGGGGSW